MSRPQCTNNKLYSFKGKSISYLPFIWIPLALCSFNLFCHLQQKWQSFNFHLHFHHETPCQAWVGSKALFPPERRPSSSAVCAGGCSISPSSHFSSLPPRRLDQQSRRPIGSVLQAVILCSRVMSPWLTITAHSVLLFSSEPLNGSLAFNKTAEPAPNSALTPLSLAHFLTLALSAWVVAIFLITVRLRSVRSSGPVSS